MSDLEQRVAALEAFVASLRGAIGAKAATPKPTPQRPPPAAGEVADDELMSKPWADMPIRKDPPRATESYAGRRMSECSEAYLLEYASFHDWKARKGREEDPPRLNNKGRPWYESDELTAKVARGWARRVRARERGDARQAELIPAHDPSDGFEEELPF